MKRVACVLLLVVAFVPVTAQQIPPAAPPAVRIQQVGVPGVQHPMSMIVPDAEYAIVGSPDWLAMGENQVWTNSRAQDLVSRMDPYTNQTVAVVPVKNPCSGLIVAEGTLWAPSCEEKVVYRIDTITNMVVAKVPVSSSLSASHSLVTACDSAMPPSCLDTQEAFSPRWKGNAPSKLAKPFAERPA